MKLAVLIALFVTVLALSAFATDWVISPINGHHYLAIDTLSWTDGESQAVALGGHLATIRNETENEWAKTSFGQFDFMWIGLHEFNFPQNPRTWVWASGEQVAYTNWAEGEPSGPFGEPFVAMEGHNDYFQLHYGEWCDLSSQWEPGKRIHIGLVEVIPVPEPSSLLALAGGLMPLALLHRRKH